MTDADPNSLVREMMAEPDFADFERKASGDEVIEPVKVEPEVKPEPDKAVDITDEDEAVDVSEDEEGEPDPAEPKRRSKPASQRIAELTAKLRQAERELEAVKAPPAETVEAPKKPDPADFEFGEADPAFIDALVDYKLEAKEAERSKTDGAQAEQQATWNRIEAGVAKAEAEAKAKYEDFDAKIAEAVTARSGEPLPPVLSVAVGLSPVGGDILYRLATDPVASERMEALAKGGASKMNAAAMAFGELEGEYLADSDDADLDIADALDMARMMGRMRARLRGKPAERAKPAIVVTNAPEPPESRARGSSGQFEVDGSTSDFAAFEKKANAR